MLCTGQRLMRKKTLLKTIFAHYHLIKEAGQWQSYLVAGYPYGYGLEDGDALSEARFVRPRAVEVIAPQTLAVSDTDGDRIRRIKDGYVTTMAGSVFGGRREDRVRRNGVRRTCKEGRSRSVMVALKFASLAVL